MLYKNSLNKDSKTYSNNENRGRAKREMEKGAPGRDAPLAQKCPKSDPSVIPKYGNISVDFTCYLLASTICPSPAEGGWGGGTLGWAHGRSTKLSPPRILGGRPPYKTIPPRGYFSEEASKNNPPPGIVLTEGAQKQSRATPRWGYFARH